MNQKTKKITNVIPMMTLALHNL